MRADLLHVIAVISNPVRYRRRIELFHRFAKRVRDAGAHLHVVEAAFGDRPFEVTEAGHPHHVQLRTFDEVWHKENLINIGISRLPSDWQYVAWVDADVNFLRPDWAAETVHQLQHYEIVQMWTHAQDLTPAFEPYQTHYGFVWCMLNRPEEFPAQGAQNEQVVRGRYYSKRKKNGYYWHPGFAWAATRHAIDTVGGLMDFPILGAADQHMAHALFGLAERTIPVGIHENYRAGVLAWQSRAEALHRDIGYVEGGIVHDFHGDKKRRFYHDRWKILVKNQYDPLADVTRDWQGLITLRPERVRLRDDLRTYFRARNEDGEYVPDEIPQTRLW